MGIEMIKTTNYYKAQNEQNIQQTNKKSVIYTNTSEIGQSLASGKITVDGVSIELSEEAQQALSEAQNKLSEDREAEMQRYMTEFNSYAAKQQEEALEDAAMEMAKAMETARRIANGDIVPATDEKKLMEYDSDLYQMAKSAAMLHQMEERKKDESLYENEEEREYTDPEAETAPMQHFGVEVEVSLGDAPAVESISEGVLES